MLHADPQQLLNTCIGMPIEHVMAICDIAEEQQCVIIFRAPGPVCQELLAEGYDTKGYRIHTKSCNWGPMAGFVMLDPRLNKKGAKGEGDNRKYTGIALRDTPVDGIEQGWSASVTHLKISSNRIDYLFKNAPDLGIRFPQGAVKTGLIEGKVEAHGIAFDFILYKAETESVWGLYCKRNSSASMRVPPAMSSAAMQQPRPSSPSPGQGTTFAPNGAGQGNGPGVFVQERFGIKGLNLVSSTSVPAQLADYEKMLALTNPPGHRTRQNDHYLNAVTGDYDLFAVWPLKKNYDPHGEDQRPLRTVGGFTDAEKRATERNSNNFTMVNGRPQASKMADPTPRIYLVAQRINSRVAAMKTSSNYDRVDPTMHPKRNVVWHSDESANPHTTEIDLPLIAFMGDHYYVLRRMAEFREFVTLCQERQQKVILSRNWIGDKAKQLPPGEGYEGMTHPSPGRGATIPGWFNR